MLRLSAVFQLHNGPDASAPLLGRLCGASPPAVIQTTDNHLHMRFVSDASNEASGFKLIFEAHSQGTVMAITDWQRTAVYKAET